MVSGINSVEQGFFEPVISSKGRQNANDFEPLTSFADEDEAIISSQAKMLNELEEFNSDGDNLVELAVSQVMAKITVEAEASVINTKKDMIDCILDIVD